MTEKSFFNQKLVRFESEAVPHFQALRRFAFYLTRNSSDVEDLIQETFAQAFKSFDNYESGTNCRAWLCKIMYHKRSQWIRNNARFCQFDEGESHFPAAFSPILPYDFMSEKIKKSLNKVPLKFRQIVWLAEVEEFTYREISEKLDIPIGTVMSRLHRGRRMLQKNFEIFNPQKNVEEKTHQNF